MKKPIFVMMVGVPGSGKSTKAEKIKNSLSGITEILSSDKLREEMFGDVNNQENNGKVFEEMNRRTKEYLSIGVNVIYDATNISSKRRTNFLTHQIGKIDCHKVCSYMATPWIDCIKNDENRERTVGVEVINRMIKQLQVPMYDEKWDNIAIESPNQRLVRGFIKYPIFEVGTFEEYKNYLKSSDITKMCIDYNQFNPHHTLTLDRHMFKSFEAIDGSEGNNLELRLACLLHDIGKVYCQSIDDEGVAHYYGHDGLSAQLAIIFLKENNLYSDNMIIHVATLIQQHMRMFDTQGIPSLKKKLHPKLFKELELLHEADTNAK